MCTLFDRLTIFINSHKSFQQWHFLSQNLPTIFHVQSHGGFTIFDGSAVLTDLSQEVDGLASEKNL